MGGVRPPIILYSTPNYLGSQFFNTFSLISAGGEPPLVKIIFILHYKLNLHVKEGRRKIELK